MWGSRTMRMTIKKIDLIYSIILRVQHAAQSAVELLVFTTLKEEYDEWIYIYSIIIPEVYCNGSVSLQWILTDVKNQLAVQTAARKILYYCSQLKIRNGLIFLQFLATAVSYQIHSGILYMQSVSIRRNFRACAVFTLPNQPAFVQCATYCQILYCTIRIVRYSTVKWSTLLYCSTS